MAQPFLRRGNQPQRAPLVRPQIAYGMPAIRTRSGALRNSPDRPAAIRPARCPRPRDAQHLAPRHRKTDLLSARCQTGWASHRQVPTPQRHLAQGRASRAPAGSAPCPPSVPPSRAPSVRAGCRSPPPCRAAGSWPRRTALRISSSLWLIYRIAVPSADSCRRVRNRISTSCGVSTLVGSSMISSLGPATGSG
jgi:hypothetical protein